MSAIDQRKEFDHNMRPRERHFPKLALRRRSADHPMIMFFLVVVSAFSAMALVPLSGSAFASLGISTTAIARPAVTVAADASDKTAALSDVDIACGGQAWGAETTECLAMIARVSGRDDNRKVRLIADAGPQTAVPNVF